MLYLYVNTTLISCELKGLIITLQLKYLKKISCFVRIMQLTLTLLPGVERPDFRKNITSPERIRREEWDRTGRGQTDRFAPRILRLRQEFGRNCISNNQRTIYSCVISVLLFVRNVKSFSVNAYSLSDRNMFLLNFYYQKYNNADVKRRYTSVEIID